MDKKNLLKRTTSPVILPFILGTGVIILLSKISTIDDKTGVFADLIDAAYVLSFTLLSASVLLLTLDFKRNSKSIILWIHLILSAPLGILALNNLIFEFGLKFIQTTTPSKFRTEVFSSPNLPDSLTQEFTFLVDSLIDLKIIGIKADSAERYFNSTTFKDDIDRKFAISFLTEGKDRRYLKFKIEPISYSPYNADYIAGFITAELSSKRSIPKNNPDGIEYISKIFIGRIESGNIDLIASDRYSLRCSGFEKCSTHMKRNFLKGMSTAFTYNINDVRFWNENSFIEQLDEHTADLRKNVLN